MVLIEGDLKKIYNSLSNRKYKSEKKSMFIKCYRGLEHLLCNTRFA